ncbi:hypothetical protein HYDPIDRAFT_73504, partial [Hydnomerulius pinastri MD-312]
IKAHNDALDALVYLLDGRQFASASADQTIRIWDQDTGEQAGEPLTGHGLGVRALAISQDG